MRFFNEINDWWDPNGSMGALHAYNALRVAYLKRILVRDQELFRMDTFSNIRAVDIGSGGGLFAESLGKLGCTVLGIDATEKCVEIARAHLARSSDEGLKDLVSYRQTTVEELAKEDNARGGFDLVSALEVIEHVKNPEEFMLNLCELLKPNGYLFMSTLN